MHWAEIESEKDLIYLCMTKVSSHNLYDMEFMEKYV